MPSTAMFVYGRPTGIDQKRGSYYTRAIWKENKVFHNIHLSHDIKSRLIH